MAENLLKYKSLQLKIHKTLIIYCTVVSIIQTYRPWTPRSMVSRGVLMIETNCTAHHEDQSIPNTHP